MHDTNTDMSVNPNPNPDRRPFLTRQMSYAWHWWINQHQDERQERGFPRQGSLYGFESMLENLHYLGRSIGKAFEGKLATTHQHCSHSRPEPIAENRLVCALGKNVTECPILLSLKQSIETTGRKHYSKEELPDSDLYQLMGFTCAWHLLATDWAGGFHKVTEEGHPANHLIDWNEGVLQDESDRRFWGCVYDSMAGDQGEEAEDSTEDISHAE